MATQKMKVKKEVDGHWHPEYGKLKAGAIMDVEIGTYGCYPSQIFEPMDEAEPAHPEEAPSPAEEKKEGEE